MKLNHFPAQTDECKFPFFHLLFLYITAFFRGESTLQTQAAAFSAMVKSFGNKLPWTKFS